MELRRSVEAILVRGEGESQQLLMSKRGPAKHGAGTVALMGGHIEEANGRSETLREAVCREVDEELGRELAEAVRAAFQLGKATIAAVVDDLRQEGVYYLHTAFMIPIPHSIEPDPDAIDSAEHVDLHWYTRSDVNELLQGGKIYPPHVAQIQAYLVGGGRYAEVNNLQ